MLQCAIHQTSYDWMCGGAPSRTALPVVQRWRAAAAGTKDLPHALRPQRIRDLPPEPQRAGCRRPGRLRARHDPSRRRRPRRRHPHGVHRHQRTDRAVASRRPPRRRADPRRGRPSGGGPGRRECGRRYPAPGPRRRGRPGPGRRPPPHDRRHRQRDRHPPLRRRLRVLLHDAGGLPRPDRVDRGAHRPRRDRRGHPPGRLGRAAQRPRRHGPVPGRHPTGPVRGQ